MALIDRITIDLTGYTATQIEKFKKAFAPRVSLENGQTWEDVTVDMAKQRIVNTIKSWVRDVDKEEATISFTDMDA